MGDSRGKFRVYKVAQTASYEMAEFETEQEAIEFCEAYGWEVKDENEFVWDMVLGED